MLEVSRVPADLYTNTLCGTGRAGPGPRYKNYINVVVRPVYSQASEATPSTRVILIITPNENNLA